MAVGLVDKRLVVRLALAIRHHLAVQFDAPRRFERREHVGVQSGDEVGCAGGILRLTGSPLYFVGECGDDSGGERLGGHGPQSTNSR